MIETAHVCPWKRKSRERSELLRDDEGIRDVMLFHGEDKVFTVAVKKGR